MYMRNTKDIRDRISSPLIQQYQNPLPNDCQNEGGRAANGAGIKESKRVGKCLPGPLLKIVETLFQVSVFYGQIKLLELFLWGDPEVAIKLLFQPLVELERSGPVA